MIEKRHKGYRVRLGQGEDVEVRHIPTKELAQDIEAALELAYERGRERPIVPPPRSSDLDDDD